MAFPRSFKNQVWYLQIPSGEIEVATSEALQRAFQCGLVDMRTPVRAFGTHAWKTMHEAAELEVPEATSIVSLNPVALSEPPPDIDRTSTWQSRADVDPKAWKPSRRPAVFTAIAAAACVFAFVFGRAELPAAAGPSAAASLHAGDTVSAVTPAAPKPRTPDAREQLHASPRHDGVKFDKDQAYKLAETDWVTRTQRPRSTFAKGFTQGGNKHSQAGATPRAGATTTARPSDPFAGSKLAGDPLDGTL